MIWKEYFKINFNKPIEDEIIKSLREKKKRFEGALTRCYSRLETIEICTSNSKPEDALLLSKALNLDILNMLLDYYDENKIDSIGVHTNYSYKLKNATISKLFEDYLNSVNLENLEEENILKIESSLSELLYKLEKEIKPSFENPIDNFKKRIYAQSILFLIISLISAGSILKYYIDARPLKEDFVGINYSDDKNTLPPMEEVTTVSIKPENGWETKKISFTEPKNIELLEIDPIHQNKARIQLKDLKIYDEKGLILFQKDLLIDNLGLSELLKFMRSEEIAPGKIVIGRAVEMESIGPNPKIFFTFDKKIEKVSQIEFTIRSTKRKNKFQD